MIDIYWLTLNEETPARGYWDQGMLEDYFAGTMWKPANFPEFKHHEVGKLPKKDVAGVVVAARHHKELVEQVNAELRKIKKVVLFLTGDEESDFEVEKINHDHIDIWVMSPRSPRHDNYHKLGTGYPTHAKEILKNIEFKKSSNIFFSGQITHKRRNEMWDALSEYEIRSRKVDAHARKSFTAGFEPKEYFERLAKAKIAPAPSGPETPDSFRLFEALEAMAVPLADEKDPKGDFDGYWEYFFEDSVPFPLVYDWRSLPSYTNQVLSDWDNMIDRQTAWWIKKKRDMSYEITRELCDE